MREIDNVEKLMVYAGLSCEKFMCVLSLESGQSTAVVPLC